MRGVGVFVLSIATAAISLPACSGASGNNDNSGQGGGSAASGTGGGGGIAVGGSGTGAAGSGGGQVCDKTSYTGELLPLDMFVMLDRSGSMDESGKWGAVTGAINQFVALPNLSMLGMGIAFFPTPPATPPPTTCATDVECGFYGPCVPFFGCSGSLSPNDSCVATDYQKPVVPIADLPGVGPQITQAIASVGPQGDSTPMAPALEGAIDYATVWAPAHPDHVTVVVLATDGEPTNCTPNTVDVAASHAAEGLGQNPSVKTFVIGVGDFPALNTIAAAGGTEKAISVSAGNAGQEFLDALNKIRGAVGCTYLVPTPTSTKTDPTKVNVDITPEGSTTPETIPKVNDSASCVGEPGWYYDPTSTKIILCPASCDLVTNTKVKVDVALGCETKIK